MKVLTKIRYLGIIILIICVWLGHDWANKLALTFAIIVIEIMTVYLKENNELWKELIETGKSEVRNE